VERFYHRLYGPTVPVVTSAVLSGRAEMRLGGITFPARFRFTHEAGRNYRHYIEVTWFGLPIMKVNERYVDGRAIMELPMRVIENEPKVDQGANLALWGEAIWFPSLFVTDPRVRWEPLDDSTAVLIVPGVPGDTNAAERFVVRFDPETDMPLLFEAMRYKAADSKRKTLWLAEARYWGRIGTNTVPRTGAITWFGDSAPWAVFHVEEAVYNADVHDYVRAKGL
jgi:hypothetical protein